MARPRRVFTEKDIEAIKGMARCHCPDSEIAAVVGASERTIRRRFGRLLNEGREIGKKNIRAVQYRLAINGDRTMLIWLGKQLLHQYDKAQQKIEQTTDLTATITANVDVQIKQVWNEIETVMRDKQTWHTPSAVPTLVQ